MVAHLGCACFYKVGMHIHKDPKDCGLCTTAPDRLHKGGCIIIPQLDMVFRSA
jgi:hypothetical protein